MKAFVPVIIIGAIVAAVFLGGGKWGSFEYGPGDWLADKVPSLNDREGLELNTLTNYEWFLDPVITVHETEELAAICGTMYTPGCAKGNPFTCDVYVGSRPSPSVIEHEKRHCRGWDHYALDYSVWGLLSQEEKNRQIQRAAIWYPIKSAGKEKQARFYQ
jgi:hypothetical protein